MLPPLDIAFDIAGCIVGMVLSAVLLAWTVWRQ
jgi:hypothetical protein